MIRVTAVGAAVGGRGVPVQARRASGYRSPVSQEPRRPRARNATAVATSPGAAVADDTPDYPGKRFGLPMTGPMSVAPMGRRLIALIVDWLLCALIVSSFTGHVLFGNAQDPHYFAAQYGVAGSTTVCAGRRTAATAHAASNATRKTSRAISKFFGPDMNAPEIATTKFRSR